MSKAPFSLKHDLHCHSFISACATDPNCTAQKVYAMAKENGYDTVCLTDHLWDNSVPGPSEWYAPQDIEHVLAAKPDVPTDSGVRCLLGCETDYTGGGHLGLAKEHFDLFDFVVIPPNHMHMKGFVRPLDVTTEEQMAELFTCRLEEIAELDIPLEKVGIAHLTCSLLFDGKAACVIKLMDEARLHAVFAKFARRGAGIELNAMSFGEMATDEENTLRLYRIAKEEGCKFYCASDGHVLKEYERRDIANVLPAVVEKLGLTEDDRYIIPG